MELQWLKSEEVSKNAIEQAFSYGPSIVIGLDVSPLREIEISLLGNDTITTSRPGEIVYEDDFYSYETKYTPGRSSTVIPAEIPTAVVERIQELAVKSYELLGCAGFARADFLYNPETQELFFSEINTLPGFTPFSMFTKMWEAEGLSYLEIVEKTRKACHRSSRTRAALERVRIHPERHRTVVGQRDLHVRSEYPGSNLQTVPPKCIHKHFIKMIRELGSSRATKWPTTFTDISEERELAYDKNLPTEILDAQIHSSLFVREDSQLSGLLCEQLSRLLVITRPDATKNHKSSANASGQNTIGYNAGLADSLNRNRISSPPTDTRVTSPPLIFTLTSRRSPVTGLSSTKKVLTNWQAHATERRRAEPSIAEHHIVPALFDP